MRDKSFDSYLFFQELESQLKQVQSVGQELRKQVVDNPNFLCSDYYLVLPSGLRELEGLALLSWWLPEEVGVLLRMQIEEKKKRLSLEDQVVLEILLQSQGEARVFLSETTNWHTRDFFGNFLPMAVRSCQGLKFRKRITKVKKPQRKRGYHDHGSLRPRHRWLPSSDWSLTQEQNKIEEKRSIAKSTIHFLRGLIS